MTIYSDKKHRKIYEQLNGPIPKDEFGRSYEIHHIDGNHSNNDPANFICVSIQEHYDIHYSQGDWSACLIMSSRMLISPEEKSKLSSQLQKEKVAAGTHHFLTRPDGSSVGSDMVKNGTNPIVGPGLALARNLKRIAAGTHNFLGEKNPMAKRLVEGTHHFQINNPSPKKIKDGTHHFLTNHPNKIQVTCPHCGRTGGATNFKRYHFDNCKLKNLMTPPRE